MRKWVWVVVFIDLFQAQPALSFDCGGDDNVYRTFDMGVQYVPRDAPVGSIIGTANMQYVYTPNTPYLCGFGDQWEARFSDGFTTVQGVRLPQMESGIGSATVVRTNVPGVGLVVSTEPPPGFRVLSGTPPYIPYKGKIPGFPNEYASVPVKFTLVKISNDIPAGSSKLDNALSTINYWSKGTRHHSVFLIGTVVRSECSIEGSGQVRIDVPMGVIVRRTFRGKDSYSRSNEVLIPMTNCTPGNYPSNQGWNYYQNANAWLRLDATAGSTIINAGRGLLGLTQESTAKGVAVQVLHKDGVTAFPLGQEVAISRLSGSSMNIELKARYIQTSDSPQGPEPGSANARAAFTITYK